MHGKLIRCLLPPWLGRRTASSAGASSDFDPQRTGRSAGCKVRGSCPLRAGMCRDTRDVYQVRVPRNRLRACFRRMKVFF